MISDEPRYLTLRPEDMHEVPLTRAEIAQRNREAAKAVSPSYHFDSIDSKIAEAFHLLAEEFERA